MNQPFGRLNTLFKGSRLVHTWHTWYWNDIMIMAPHRYFSVATLALSVHAGPFTTALVPSPVLRFPMHLRKYSGKSAEWKSVVVSCCCFNYFICVCTCVFIWIRWNHLTTDSIHASDGLEWEAALLVHLGENWKGCTIAWMGISQKS